MRDSTPAPATTAEPGQPGTATGPRPGRLRAAWSAGRLRALWSALVGAIGAAVGIAPHVLHHIGPLAGAALVAGVGRTALFGVLGLVASVPFLLRLRRRFGSWWAPVIALAVFAAMFSVSAFVIGPAINGDPAGQPGPRQPSPSVDHGGHHPEQTPEQHNSRR